MKAKVGLLESSAWEADRAPARNLERHGPMLLSTPSHGLPLPRPLRPSRVPQLRAARKSSVYYITLYYDHALNPFVIYRLSPSMIAASASTQSMSNRPISSPYPSTSDALIVSPTDSVITTRPHKVGTGLRYYTEQNPAPTHARVQIPDATDIPDHDPLQSPLLPSHPYSSAPASECTTFNSEQDLPVPSNMTGRVPSPTLWKELGILRGEGTGPLSPPPTPPVHEREGNVPRIRISSGEDLS